MGGRWGQLLEGEVEVVGMGIVGQWAGWRVGAVVWVRRAVAPAGLSLARQRGERHMPWGTRAAVVHGVHRFIWARAELGSTCATGRAADSSLLLAVQRC